MYPSGIVERVWTCADMENVVWAERRMNQYEMGFGIGRHRGDWRVIPETVIRRRGSDGR